MAPVHVSHHSHRSEWSRVLILKGILRWSQILQARNSDTERTAYGGDGSLEPQLERLKGFALTQGLGLRSPGSSKLRHVLGLPGELLCPRLSRCLE